MKKRINLLVKQDRYTKLERSFGNLKWLLVFLVVLFVSCNVLVSYLFINQKKAIDDLTQEKKEILEFLLANNKAEANFVYLNTKEQQLLGILKSDVNFYPYYQLLNQTLKTLAPQAILESVTINKSRETVFTLIFPDSNSMLTFFKFAESDDFLKNFNKLILSEFNHDQIESQRYELIFKGTFIALNEN